MLLLSQEEAIGCKQWMRRVLPMEEVCGRKAMVTGYKGTERKVKGFSTLFSMSRRRREGVTHPLCSDVIMASAVLGDRASDCSSFLLNLGGFEIKSFITKTRGACWRRKSADPVLGLNGLMGLGSYPRKRWPVYQLWPTGRVF